MQINPYLNFDGRCEVAFKFYEKCLRGKIEAMMTFEQPEMAEHVPPDWRKKIMHASLSVGKNVIFGSDGPPGRYEKPQGIQVSLQLTDIAEAERIYKELAEGGQVVMPLQQTFWAARFGMLVDKFAIPWMINCEAKK